MSNQAANHSCRRPPVYGASGSNATRALPRIGVVQDGARLHYGLAIALGRAGLLDRIFTDWYAERGSAADVASRLVGLLNPAAGQRMQERQCPELKGVPVFVPLLEKLVAQLGCRRFPTPEQHFEWAAERFGSWLLRNRKLAGLDGLTGFIRNLHPRAIAAARGRGLKVVADQIIAPAAVEQAEAKLQAERWPGWEPVDRAHDFALVERVERRSWTALDHITCGSDYVRQGLLRQGVPDDKISVVPYPDVSTAPPPDRRRRIGPILVGFVGAVGLRKGAPYFLAVARRFDPAKVRFIMVGPIGLDPAVAQREQGPAELIGPVPRSQVREWLSRFDIFFFPSTCEGSAGAIVEALGLGLPIVTSTNAGSTVRDGIEGFVDRYDHVDRFADCIARLAAHADLRAEMGRAAHQRHALHHPNAYAESLKRIMHQVMGGG